jgi:hypothetical protein
MGVPEDYVPEVLISDAEFATLYANRNEVTNEDKFHARDYVVDQLHKCTDKVYNGEGYGSTEDVLAELPKERLEALFWGVGECSCCYTHMHNRPNAIDSWDDRSMLDRVTQEEITQSRCYCHCRMAKRMFRHAYLDVPNLPPLLEIEVDDDETRSAGSVSDDEIEG